MDRVPLKEVLGVLHCLGLELFVLEGNPVQEHKLFTNVVIAMLWLDVAPLSVKALISERFPVSMILLELLGFGTGTNAVEMALDSMNAAGVVESSADEDGVLV